MAVPETKVIKPVGQKTVAGKPSQQEVVKKATRPPAFRIESNSGGQRRERYLKLLIYGNYGVGKTTLAATSSLVPSMGDVLMINAEAGDLSLEGMEDIDTITINTFKALGQINEFLKQHCEAREKGDMDKLITMEAVLKGCEPADITKPREYKTLIIDTLSEVESYCFDQLLGITDTITIDQEVQSAEWGEYKQNNKMIQRVIRAFRDLPMNVIFTCGEKYNQDETKKYKYTLDMTGQLAKKVQGFMDMVGYYVMGRDGDKIVRKLCVLPSPTGKFDAKHRYARFKGDSFMNPTMESILKEVGLLDKEGAPLK